jgi:hypothetical protein
MRIVLFLAVITLVPAAQSGEPPETVGQQAGPETNSSSETEKVSDFDKRGTKELPFVVESKIVKDENQTDNEKNDRTERRESDRWIRGIGVATFLILLVQTFVFGRQAKRLKETVDSMNTIAAEQRADVINSLAISDRTARANEGAVERMRQYAISELRAYIFMREIRHPFSISDDKKTVHYTFDLIWGNVGRTAAKNARIHVRYEFRDNPLPEDFDFNYIPKDKDVGTAFIPPGDSGGGARFVLTADEVKLVIDDAKYFYVIGWVKYFDVFEDTPERITRVCRRIVVTGNPHDPKMKNPIEGMPFLDGCAFFIRVHDKNNCADE